MRPLFRHAQVKVVLRRADKQKIPMEIPEAQELAMEEIIAEEVKDEKRLVRQDMEAEANEIKRLEEEAQIAEMRAEEKAKMRKRKWAVVMIQKCWRSFVASRATRALCYLRYSKHYDPASGLYYYADKKTKKTFWHKPKLLGSYDVEPEAGWIRLLDARDDPYYYNPRKWTMNWTQPWHTKLCDICKDDFAVCRLNRDELHYCDGCINNKANALLMEGIQPTKIAFRSFKGNQEGGSDTIFEYLRFALIVTHRILLPSMRWTFFSGFSFFYLSHIT